MKQWYWLAALLTLLPFYLLHNYSPVEIRPLNKRDKGQCCQMISATIRENYKDFLPPQEIAQEIAHTHKKFALLLNNTNKAHNFCAYATEDDDKTVVGIICAHVTGADCISLDLLFVHPQRQKNGIGKKLYSSMIDHFMQHNYTVTKIHSTAHPDNSAARKFHARNGFKQVGTVQHERLPHRLLVMEKSLTNKA